MLVLRQLPWHASAVRVQDNGGFRGLEKNATWNSLVDMPTRYALFWVSLFLRTTQSCPPTLLYPMHCTDSSCCASLECELLAGEPSVARHKGGIDDVFESR